MQHRHRMQGVTEWNNGDREGHPLQRPLCKHPQGRVPTTPQSPVEGRGDVPPTQQGSGGAAFTSPLPRLEGELPPNGATGDQHLAIQRAGSGRPGPALASPSGCRRSGAPKQAFSEIISATHRMGRVLCTVPSGPSSRMRQGQARSADDHDLLHKTVPRSCVEAFLRLRHAAPLGSVPQGPEHASVLRGIEPAHRELKEIPRSLPMLTAHSSSIVTTVTWRG
ncbi:hypothetical protein GL50803_00116745 [Giardia duodenalis]|uniref:Uncharacterized protein n=1 Tax=Giardia intestinalis (strain ATCC 50803 / WB clone C6) TaxID=184922 RepID=D3KI85_GIAIC|nr:hypothetical protein GL50803_00116745 [Giardia intestinalis]KAE8301704.1 hypothetical protein GL50803_00116745 [Giardia intestinalis]